MPLMIAKYYKVYCSRVSVSSLLLLVDTIAYVELGVIQQQKALQGDLIVKLNHDSTFHLGSLSSLFVKVSHTLVPYRIEHFFWQHRKAILKLQGVDDLETAQCLRGCSILVPREALSQFFFEDFSLNRLLGYHVVDAQEGNLGTVQAIYTHSHQKLLSIAYQDQELLIPYHKDLVTHIDHEQKTIVVELPDGFIKAMW